MDAKIEHPLNAVFDPAKTPRENTINRIQEKATGPSAPDPVIKSTVEIPMPTTVQRMTTFLTGKAIPADAKVSVGVIPAKTRAGDKHTLQISWES